MFGGVSHVPIPWAQSPSVPELFDLLYMHAEQSTRNNNQILHGDQTRCEEKNFTVDHEC